MFQNLSPQEEHIAAQIVDISVKIHKNLGPGLLESVYEKCFAYELSQRNLAFVRQQAVSIHYEALVIDDGLRLDLLVEDLVIVELKAQENYHPVWEAQLLSYLKLTNKRLGLLLNFHVPLMKNGIKRMIL
jgi:GxxExxY protein